MRFEWKHRADFAEIAEAVGCNTDDVMAATGYTPDAEPIGGVLVLYTIDTHGPPDQAIVHRALLERNEDGVLHIVKHAPIATLADFMARVEGTEN
jgi:hypothetical protein